MIDIGLGHYLTLGAVIFSLGVIGIFLNRKNIIVILISIELILLAVNINLESFIKKHNLQDTLESLMRFHLSYYL